MANINMKQFVKMVKDRFEDDDINTIVEVGSLDGVDATYFKSCWTHATVIAIEGLKENYEQHKDAVGDIEFMHAVVSSGDGQVDYHIKETNGIHGIFDRGQIYGKRKIKVECHRLDSLLEGQIDVLKIDVEGATYEALLGMGELLDTVKIMHIETEDCQFFQGQKLHGDVEKLLGARGFKCVNIQGQRIQSGTQYDSVWVKK